MVFTAVDPELLSCLIEASEDETETVEETDEVVMCEYFARCANVADGTLPNPVLGAVPCCNRCANQVSSHVTPFGEAHF